MSENNFLLLILGLVFIELTDADILFNIFLFFCLIAIIVSHELWVIPVL